MAKARKTRAGSYELTERQAHVLELVRHSVRARGFAPTRGELAQALNLKHQSAIDNHLHALARKGWVEIQHGIERGIRLLREGVPLYEPDDFRRLDADRAMPWEQFTEPRWIDCDWLWERFNRRPDLCLTIADDAMDKAGLPAGELVALRRYGDTEIEAVLNDTPVIAARVRSNVVLRRYHKVGETRIELRPESTCRDFEPIVVEKHADDMEIIAVALGAVIRRTIPNTG